MNPMKKKNKYTEPMDEIQEDWFRGKTERMKDNFDPMCPVHGVPRLPDEAPAIMFIAGIPQITDRNNEFCTCNTPSIDD